jgi:pimeloyl-ACP methyl ester carboxylesterase
MAETGRIADTQHSRVIGGLLMSTYVLIHGAWHGGWCWSEVAGILRKQGHTVLTPDLPGHGLDKTPISQISLQLYAEAVVKLLDQQTEPAILVGHSMGGIVVSRAAELRPEKVKILTYVCAFLLRNGETLVQIAQSDSNALVMPNLVFSEDQSNASVKDEMLKKTFYTDCTEEIAAQAQSRLVPQALAPFGSPQEITETNYGRLPRVYIECTHDRAISIDVQRAMVKASPCKNVFSIETDHSPFLSAPTQLAAHLGSLAS